MTKNPHFRNRIFMEGGASEADISTARAGVHSRTCVLKFGPANCSTAAVASSSAVDGTCAGRAPSHRRAGCAGADNQDVNWAGSCEAFSREQTGHIGDEGLREGRGQRV